MARTNIIHEFKVIIAFYKRLLVYIK